MSTNRWPGVYKRGKTWSFRAQFGEGEGRWGVSGSGYLSAKDASEARTKAIDAARPMHGIQQRPDPTLTLGRYLRAWHAEHTTTVRPSTASAYLSRVNSICATSLADKKLRSLTDSDYLLLVRELRDQSPSHTNLTLKLGTLSAALTAAVRAGLIPGHPVAGIRVSRTAERFEPGVWSVAEVRRFLDHRAAAHDPLLLCWHLAVMTGMRRGELHGLKQGDIDLDRGVLHVRRQRVAVRHTVIEQAPKTAASEAPVFLGSDTVAMVREHLEQATSEYIVTDPRTRRPYANMKLFAGDWERACVNAGVPKIRFHDLRHTSASLLAASGVPLVLAQQRLRHWSPTMTARYTHALDGMGAQVAEQLGALVAGR